MHIYINLGGRQFQADISTPVRLSIPINSESPNAFYLPNPQYEYVRGPGFTGVVREGGSCNVQNISLSPHGNGTHTECCGHISPEHHKLNAGIKQFMHIAEMITVEVAPEDWQGFLVTREQLENACRNVQFFGNEITALIVRTNNYIDKKSARYGGLSAPAFHPAALQWLRESGIKHLLTDLPSVDPETSKELPAHRAFFQNHGQWVEDATITEMIYVEPAVRDGLYLLQMQIIDLESDASPSMPVVYPLEGVVA